MLHGKFTALNADTLEKFKINELNVWLQNLGKQQMILKKVEASGTTSGSHN